ncbi:MAG: WXG100 family type VII secretion target [Thermocrispum sp.]
MPAFASNGSNAAVDSDGMRRAGGLFEAASSQATSQKQSVNGEMAALAATWQGDASARYSQAMSEWEANFQIIINKLNEMVEVMGGNAQAYDTTSADNEAIAGGWNTGLAGFEA